MTGSGRLGHRTYVVEDELRDDDAAGEQAAAAQHQQEPVHDGRAVDEQGVTLGWAAGCGARMRERPAAGDDLSTLDRAEPPTEGGQDPGDDGGDEQRDTRVGGAPARGSPITSPSSMPVVEMIEAAKISPGGVLRKRNTACWRPWSIRRPATPPST